MGSHMKRAAALALAVVIACGAVSGCGKKDDGKFDGTKTLLTLGEDKVSVGAANFRAKYTQAETYKMYTQYFGMSGTMFDQVTNTESGGTFGETLKESVLSDLKRDMVIRQHAEEYGVSLTDEDKKAIDEAAQSYIDGNSQEVLDKIGASKEDIVSLLELQTIQSMMMDPIVKDVDTEISDEECRMSSLTYVSLTVPEETASSGVESVETAVEPVADAAGDTTSGTESVAEEPAETPQQSETKAKAQKIIDAVMASGDVANADIEEIAKSVDDSLFSLTGQFLASDPTDTTLDASIPAAVEGLAEGTLIETPVRSEDGSKYYVVRFDKEFNEDLTETKKSSIMRTRKQDLYDETVDKWVEEADIKVDEKVWKTVSVTDLVPYTLTDPVIEEAVESGASTVEVESVAEAVEDATTDVIEALGGAAAAAAGAAGEAASTVEEAVSAVEEAVSAVEEAAE